MAFEIVKRTIHVHFSDAQKAAMADQMADIQAQIESTTEQKKQVLSDANAKLTTLRAQASEYAHAVRSGEGDIEVDCLWRLDPHKPFKHLWRIDTMEIIATEGFADPNKKKGDKQLDLTAATPAAPPSGNAPAAGSEPGAQVIKVSFAPRPPCPAPVDKGPAGICGEDGDVDHQDGFCAVHFASIDSETRGMIVDAIRERRRAQRMQDAADRQKRQVEDAIATPEEEKRARERQGRLAELRAKHRASNGIHRAAEPLDGTQRCVNCNGVLSTEPAYFQTTALVEVDGPDGAIKRIVEDGKLSCTRPSDSELLAAAVAALPPEQRATALAALDLIEGAPDAEAAAAGGAAAEAEKPEMEEPSEYSKFRPDGWPLCPGCDEDELWSPSTPADIKTIVRCSACGWRPTADPIPTRHLAPVPAAPADLVASEGSAKTIKIGDREINVTGIENPMRLLKGGPCPHVAETGAACYTCTNAAVEGERIRVAEGAPAAGAEHDDATPPAAGECAKVRRVLTADESRKKVAICHSCNKEIKVKPVVEDGTYASTHGATRTMGSGPVLVELCAGSAAVSLRWLSARAKPPIAYQGGKRAYADAILIAMGLQPGGGARDGRVVLVEAGPWGEAWAHWAAGGIPGTVERLRAWASEDPRELWTRLKNAPVPADVGERVATWIVLMRWTRGICPPRIIGEKWRPGGGFNDASANGAEWKSSDGRVDWLRPVRCNDIADDIAAFESLGWDRFSVLPVDARTVDPIHGAHVYIDPDYQGTTGYGHTFPRADVLTTAERWRAAGCTVTISEAVPLPLDGWHHHALGKPHGNWRTWSKQQSEWLTISKPAGGQIGLAL